jgi:hypothetical protein
MEMPESKSESNWTTYPASRTLNLSLGSNTSVTDHQDPICAHAKGEKNHKRFLQGHASPAHFQNNLSVGDIAKTLRSSRYMILFDEDDYLKRGSE